MNVAMFSNTYLPHVGGVAHSVSTFVRVLRDLGHDIRVVAPQFEGASDSSELVLRTPAVQNFNGSDFSVTIPQPGLIADYIDSVRPQVVHSHHPFLLGDAALRTAWTRRLPLVFTHHTLYEHYTHYVPLDSKALQRAVVQMATDYSNLCTHVIAPSQSVADLLAERGVVRPITVLPTGIDCRRFATGDGADCRHRLGIDPNALVVGHVGRLAAEKNLGYLAQAVGLFLAETPSAVFLVVGSGDQQEEIERSVAERAGPGRAFLIGSQTGQDLIDAYAAMDVFVFSSQSETQGLVLAEAMAAGCAVVALDGPGVREVVSESSGLLLPNSAPPDRFAAALGEITRDRQALSLLGDSARESIADWDQTACAERLLALYGRLLEEQPAREQVDFEPWDRMLRRLEIEWSLLVNKTAALRAAVAAQADIPIARE
jgi:glycosyltransferase involved in cell wall biosynthesis